MSGNDRGETPQDRYYERYAQATGSATSAPAPKNGLPRWWLFAAAGLVAVITLVAVGVFSGFGLGGSTSSSSAPVSSAGADPSSTPTGSTGSSGASPTTAANGALQARAVVSGWQPVGGVVNSTYQIYGAYDAPPNWKVQQDGYISYKDEGFLGIRKTSWGASAFNAGMCAGKPNAAQATASFVDIGKRDPAEAINGVMAKFGAAASLNADKTTHAAQGVVTSENIKIAGGSLAAVRGKLIVTQGTLSDDCGKGKQTTLHGAAFSINGRSVFLLVTVVVWPGQTAPDAATIDKVISSLRPAGGE